jgi:hypothetical protein
VALTLLRQHSRPLLLLLLLLLLLWQRLWMLPLRWHHQRW